MSIRSRSASAVRATSHDPSGVYALTMTGPMHAAFDAGKSLEALPVSGVEVPGGEGPIVAVGGRLAWIANAGTTKYVVEMRTPGGKASMLYTSPWVMPAVEIESNYVYYADQLTGVYRVRVND